ncbi:hypothetical protein HYU09_04875 [Candidatus Woesearchaeota archaeon]|nr:hypothetical protein [Candidatus Woesearchaeota archaeon]
MVKIKVDIEKVLLALFFSFILFLGPGELFDHRIKHDFPFAYGASDAFQHQVRAEAIKDMGNFRYEADYISRGLEDVVGTYPPLSYHLGVIFSYLAGVETYDSMYFIIVFFPILGSLVMFFIIRDYNRTAALFSLPLSMIVFSSPIIIGFLWGHWPSILAQSFLIFFFWSIMRMDLHMSFLLIAIALSAVALTHTAAAIFGIIFLVLFFGTKFISKSMTKQDIKVMILSFAAAFIITFYYLVIFWNTWAKVQPYSFSVEPVSLGTPMFYIAGFGLLLLPMAIGAIASLSKLKSLHISLVLAFAMLIAGFLNYAGFSLRAFQVRFFWPIYLSVFVGLCLYLAFKLVIKKQSYLIASFIFIILLVSFSGLIKFPVMGQTEVQAIPSIPYSNIAASQGLMNQYNWEAFGWISKNTEKDAAVYFFYGDIYSNDAVLRNSKRVHFQVWANDFIEALQERKIKRQYYTELPGDSGAGLLARTSFFGFGNAHGPKTEGFSEGQHDICLYDYYVFDRASRQEVLAQYNMLIASEMMKRDYFSVVFQNEVVLILKNNNPGADCIEERSF